MTGSRTSREGPFFAAALIALGLAAPAAWAQAPAEIQAALDATYAKYKGLQEGRNADYSVRAQKAIADISNALGGNPLASKAR